MSQFGGPEINTKILIDNADVGPKLDDSSRKVDGFKESTERATKAQGSFADSIKKSIGTVTSFVGAITSAIGVAFAFVRIGEKIRTTYDDAFRTAKERAEEFKATIDTTNAADALKKTRDEIAKVEADLGFSLRNEALGKRGVALLVGNQSVDDLRQRLEELRKAESSFLKQARARELEERRAETRKANEAVANDNAKSAESSAKAIETQTQQLEQARQRVRQRVIRESATEEERIVIDALERINEVREAFANQQDQSEANALALQIETQARVAIGELRKREFEEQEERHRRSLEQIDERREREMDSLREIRDMYRQIADEQTRGLGFGQASSLGIVGNTQLLNALVIRQTR